MDDSLKEIAENLKAVKLEIKTLQKQLLKKQTELVGLVKMQSDLKEEKRIFDNKKVIVEITQRDLDIDCFKILKKSFKMN